MLAAQQYYICHEDSAMNIEKLANNLITYLPEEKIQDADEKSYERWVHLILNAFRKVSSIRPASTTSYNLK